MVITRTRSSSVTSFCGKRVIHVSSKKRERIRKYLKILFHYLLHTPQRSSTQKCSSEFECNISDLADLPERGVKSLYMKLCGNNFSISKYLIVNKSNISTLIRAKIFLHLAVGPSPGLLYMENSYGCEGLRNCLPAAIAVC